MFKQPIYNFGLIGLLSYHCDLKLNSMKLFVVIAIISTSFSFQDWTLKKIDDRVTISFPEQPTEKIVTKGNLNAKSYITENTSEHFKCLVTGMDLSLINADSASLAKTIQQPEGLQNLVSNIVNSKKGFLEVSKSYITVKNHPALEALIDTKSSDVGQKHYDKMYLRLIIVGSKMYQLYFYNMDANPHADIRDKFFNSFTVD